MTSDTLDLLLSRRSVVANNLTGPGPDDAQLETILRAGARVPDHGKLAPWRFIRFRGAARQAFGARLLDILRRRGEAMDATREAFEAGRFVRAPVVVAVISSPVACKIPEWEQVLSAGAVCQNMLVAASALGFASQWLTEWYAYDDAVREALGLAEHERVAGFVYLGSAQEPPSERPRPDLAQIVSDWTPDAA